MEIFSALTIGLFSTILGVLVFGIIVSIKSSNENKRIRKKFNIDYEKDSQNR